MINAIFENIQEHLCMLELAVLSSEKIKIAATGELLDEVVLENENRERIVNIVAKIQRKIEDQINLLGPSEITLDGIQVLKSWFQDLNLLSEQMLTFDSETVELLAQQKESTTKEIATIFKNKEVFKGYNHAGKK